MPRPGSGGVPEKSKNFSGTLKKLFLSLEKWRVLVIISLVLAIASAILALITPNKLSELTDTITEGIKPNINEQTITEIMSNQEISEEDKMAFIQMMQNAETSDDSDNNYSELYANMDKLPESIKKEIEPSIDMEKVTRIAILLLSLHLISAVFSFIETFSLNTVSNKFAKSLRTKISQKINKIPLNYFDTHETGDVLSRITNDVDTVGRDMDNSISTMVTSITLLIGSTIMMFVTNWIMAITAIVASIIGFSFMALILSKSQKYFISKRYNDKKSF